MFDVNWRRDDLFYDFVLVAQRDQRKSMQKFNKLWFSGKFFYSEKYIIYTLHYKTVQIKRSMKSLKSNIKNVFLQLFAN